MLYLVFGQETVKEGAVSMGMVWRREKSVTWNTYVGRRLPGKRRVQGKDGRGTKWERNNTKNICLKERYNGTEFCIC